MATDKYYYNSYGLNDPIPNAIEITPNDSEDLAYVPRSLYIGTGGDLFVDMKGVGTNIPYRNIQDGTTFPRAVTRVYATGTTATDIIAEW